MSGPYAVRASELLEGVEANFGKRPLAIQSFCMLGKMNAPAVSARYAGRGMKPTGGNQTKKLRG